MAATRKIRRRIYVIFTCVLLLLMAVVTRLFFLQVIQNDRFLELAKNQSQGNIITMPVRGNIYDRNMNPLAESIDTKSVVMSASKFAPDAESLQRVSDRLDINLEGIYSRQSTRTRLTYLKRKLSPEELGETKTLFQDEAIRKAGIFMVPDTKRFYPEITLAAHLLGFTGLDEKGYDNHGLEGLEYHYDDYLRGHAARYAVPMDARRNSLQSWELEVKNAGHDLILTIDKNIQHMVERELEATFRNERARHATVIVMDPYSGEILAMANYPNYNPNEFSRYPQSYYRNWAVAWDYEPGSTFKIIQTAAAFEEGLLSPRDRYDNKNGFLEAASRSPEEWRNSGLMSVEDILIKSDNVGAGKISEQLGGQRFYDYIRRFGFGEPSGIDLPGEAVGKLREPSEWSSLSLQSLSIGQEISVTPLQITRAFAVIANGGVLYTPHVVKEIRKKDGTPVQSIQPTKARRVISRKSAQFMREILAKVVDRGTGKRAAVPGYRVAGKTGTAQKFNTAAGDYSNTSFVTSFVGFAPAHEPRVVISAIVDEPALNEWGGTVAAPLFKNIAKRILPYLDVPPDTPGREFVAFVK